MVLMEVKECLWVVVVSEIVTVILENLEGSSLFHSSKVTIAHLDLVAVAMNLEKLHLDASWEPLV